MLISLKKSVAAGRRQQGAALLIFMIIFAMAALAYLVGNLSSEEMADRRVRQTDDALTKAREALIGYALRYREQQVATGNPDAMYGYLPLPDLGTNRNNNTGCTQEGCDANTFTGNVFDVNGVGPSVVGRLPWRTLGIEPLRDGSGECLWLIVSSLHSRILRTTPAPTPPAMNWDTLGQFDIVVANGTSALASALNSAHDRPVAVIFSPGPPLPGQDRGLSGTDDVTVCGGNYEAKNYLDLVDATVFNYLAGTNSASGATGDSDLSNDPNDVPPSKRLSVQGKVFASGGNFLPHACTGDCTALANDKGLALTSDTLFGAIRKHAHFRTDINSMLERMTTCLRDQIAAGGGLVPTPIPGFTAPADKSAGRIPGYSCYDNNQEPRGYFDNYKEMIFVAQPSSGYFTVNDETNCAGVLIFANQRGNGQRRITSTTAPSPPNPPGDKDTLSNYLEGNNLTSFTTGAPLTPVTTFGSVGGPALLERSPPQAIDQDIARCIPAGASMNTVTSSALDALGGQIVAYDPNTQQLTLGRIFSITNAQRANNASAFFGCSWTPESRLMGNGFRSYFQFNIQDAVEGFTFAVIDADRNGPNVCGAAQQYLGYSGNNGGITSPVVYPKIGIEIDTSKQTAAYGVGRGQNDPNYNGGHAAIVYWGTEADPNDDNAHGLPAQPDPTVRPPPQNPEVPSIVTQQGAGVARLDATSVSNLLNKTFHVRMEMQPIASDDDLHMKTYRIDVWLERVRRVSGNANVIAAMQNTTRPLRDLYPSIDSASFIHLQDQPKIYDIHDAGTDSYTPVLNKIRLGFTTSQSTAAKDQIITISNFFTTWLP